MLLTGAALAAPVRYVCDISEAVVYQISGRTKKAMPDAELIAIGDPFEPGGYFAKLMPPHVRKPAIAFFSGTGEFIKTVSINAQTAEETRVIVSPHGTRLLISNLNGEYASWDAYSFPALKRLASTPESVVWSMGPFWLDEDRFVCTVYSEAQKKRNMPDEAPKGYSQAEIFNIASQTFTPLQKHSLTDEYYVTGVQGGLIRMTRYYVKDAAHWASGFGGYEGDGEVFGELVYRWDPEWEAYPGWETPKDLFTLETGEKPQAFLVSGAQRKKLNIKVSSDGMYYWFIADRNTNAELQDEEPAVYIFNSVGAIVTRAPLEEGTRVYSVSFSPEERVLLVDYGYADSPAEHIYDLYRSDSGMKHIQSLRLADGNFFWLDSWRLAYTKMNIEFKRPSGKTGYALDAVVYDSAVDLFETLQGGDERTDFRVTGVLEDGSILIEKDSVESPEEWSRPEKHRRTTITYEPPAAG